MRLVLLFTVRIEVLLSDGTSLLFLLSSFLYNDVNSHSNIHLELYEGRDVGRRKLEDLWNTEAIVKNKLISHLCKVLNHPCTDKIEFSTPDIPPETISDLIQGQEVRVLAVFFMDPSMRTALKIIRYSSVLRMNSVPFEKNEYTKLKEILMKNLDEFSLMSSDIIPIEDILLSNSREFITKCSVTAKQLNRFLKLWMIGSNRRFEYFSCRITGDSDGLLKGIEYEQIPMDSTEVYKRRRVDLPNYDIPLKGGMRITRHDGTKAIISIETIQTDRWLSFFCSEMKIFYVIQFFLTLFCSSKLSWVCQSYFDK
uniref:FBA_2 domain-containing protein n=1 Tax=Caenorhabditis tropicalis TaxID=1561998 RepID=A0A1I7UUQ2_9PELO